MFFVCAAVKQLDPTHSLDYEGAVVYCCLSRFMEWTLKESGLEYENLSCQRSPSVKDFFF